MRTSLFAIVFLSIFSATAAAEDPPKGEHIEAQSDIGIDFGRGHWRERFLGRVVLNELDKENRGEAHFGLSWHPTEHGSFDLTAGYAYSHGLDKSPNALVIGMWKDMNYMNNALRLHAEGLHRYNGKYRYDGYYSLEYWIAGVHVENRGGDVGAGFQIGSGHGLLPFTYEVVLTFGITAGMPDRSGRFVLSFDFR
jgi:hypothetical protein